jgi:hypothetical protein
VFLYIEGKLPRPTTQDFTEAIANRLFQDHLDSALNPHRLPHRHPHTGKETKQTVSIVAYFSADPPKEISNKF